MFAQNGFGWQMIGAAAAATAAATAATGMVQKVTLAGSRRTGHCVWRSAGQRQVSRHFVADDPDALGREESDIEAAFASPPHRLFRRRHVDHRDHITHLKRL